MYTLYDISELINLSDVYIYINGTHYLTILYKSENFKHLNKSFKSVNIDITKYIIAFSRDDFHYKSIEIEIKHDFLNFVKEIKKQQLVYFMNDKIYKNNLIKLDGLSTSSNILNGCDVGFINEKMNSIKDIIWYQCLNKNAKVTVILPELNI